VAGKVRLRCNGQLRRAEGQEPSPVTRLVQRLLRARAGQSSTSGLEGEVEVTVKLRVGGVCGAWTVQKQRWDKPLQLYVALENDSLRYPGNKNRV